MSKILKFIDGEPVWLDKTVQAEYRPQQAVVSDDLGCIAQQVDELRADAKINGFSAVEYKPDPTTMINGHPTYYQLHCNSPDQLRRYEQHLSMPNQCGKGGGAILSPEAIDQAKALLDRVRGPREAV